jgi:hypothetical protein
VVVSDQNDAGSSRNLTAKPAEGNGQAQNFAPFAEPVGL